MVKNKKELVEPELSYKIVGLLFKVHSALGPGYQEKYYQKAFELELKQNKIPYSKEINFGIEYLGEKLGRYFLDFLIDDKIIVELKAVKFFSKKDIGQVLRYLRHTNIKLGILVNFKKESLEFKRIINNEFRDNS